MIDRTKRPTKLAQMIQRTGLSNEAFGALVDHVWGRKDEVPASIARLAAAAREAGITILSHDDNSIERRQQFRDFGSVVSEFPTLEHVAVEAIGTGEHVVFGAPNVMRGGSHTGCPSAREMVQKRLCTILASDYYYPSLAQAPHLLDRLGHMPFTEAWELVSRNPARAIGLGDRGILANGQRADLILAERDEAGFRIIATVVAGKVAFTSDPARLYGSMRVAA